MKTITINVTRGDIEKGCKGEADSCPIARAIRRRMKTGCKVSVWHVFNILPPMPLNGRRGPVIVGTTPNVAYEWAQAFDLGAPVQPFRFKIELPEEVVR